MTWIDRTVRSNDRGVAMASALLLMIIVLGFSIIMLGLVLTQIRPTLINAKSTRTVSAAQAGLDAAVSQIRGALDEDTTTGEIMGDRHSLPCVARGDVEGNGSSTKFEVTIRYYNADPTNQPKEWRDDAANQIRCRTDGSVPGLGQVPGYALLTSKGEDPSSTTLDPHSGRTVEATYKFSLKTVNIAGGRIYSADRQYCLVADYSASGSPIRYQRAISDACVEPNDLNRWIWDKDYKIHLGVSRSLGTDLCISGRPTLSGNGVNHSTQNHRDAQLLACTTGTNDPQGQMWSWRHGQTWHGQNAANTAAARTSLSTQDSSDLTGQRLRVSSPGYDQGRPWNGFDPEPNVGAAAASYETNQIVNMLEFGRCMDVFRDKLYTPYQILYPCKQDPTNTGDFRWNHKWYYSEPAEGTTETLTQIQVQLDREGGTFDWYGDDPRGNPSWLNPGNPFCLLIPTTPGFRYAETPNQLPPFNRDGEDMRTEYFPRFVDSNIFDHMPNRLPSGFTRNCTDSNRTTWIRTTESADQNYSWTFRPASDPTMCLAVGPKHHGDQTNASQAHPKNLSPSGSYNYYVGFGGDMWSTVVIRPCDGNMGQKWNANPDRPGSPLRDFVEISRATD